MAKDQPKTEQKPEPQPKVQTTCNIVLRRSMKVDTQELDVGAPLAEVKLEPGVTVDFLARALFDGLAGEA